MLCLLSMHRSEDNLGCHFAPSTWREVVCHCALCLHIPVLLSHEPPESLLPLPPVSCRNTGITASGFPWVLRLWPEVLMLAWQGLYSLSRSPQPRYSFPWLLWSSSAQSSQSPVLPIQSRQRMGFGGMLMSSCVCSCELAWQVKVTAAVREFPSVDTQILQPTTPKLKCIFNKVTLCNKAI